MKTIYLKAETPDLLISDIKQVVEDYEGSIEFSNGIIHGHWIGMIPESRNIETGEVKKWLEGYHANLLVPKDFDETIFNSLVIPPPTNPVHKFT